MSKIWLIVNSASGSYDAAMPDALAAAAREHGGKIDRVVTIPDDDIPDRATLEQHGVDILAIHTGDGTINSAARALEGWKGSMLVLPGGTMNLLARSLHGDDATATDIMAAALADTSRHAPVTIVVNEEGDVDIWGLVGLFVGPTTAWGDVRETLRRRDIGGMIEQVGKAIDQTFSGAPVRLAGGTRDYPSIYVEPIDGQLRVAGVTADDPGELFRHGFAWLGGDFRTGPHDDLGKHSAIVIESAAHEVGLLVDGERGHARPPIRLRAALAPVNFIATRPVQR